MIRIGSRGSALALWQSNHIRGALYDAQPGVEVSIEVIQTTGDKITDVPLSKIGDKGLFTKELDRALLDGRIDLAVHSLKDVPTRLEPGLTIAAVTVREDPSDALICAPGEAGSLAQLPPGARVGTSSLRRRSQLLSVRPDLIADDVRGNIDTRLEAVRAHKYHAIILALAGLKRLGRGAEVSEILKGEWLPAVGQGALAVVCRDSDEKTIGTLRFLDDADTRCATDAERALLRELEGGCQIPIGALGTVRGDVLRLCAVVGSLDGTRMVRGELSGQAANARQLGRELAYDLLARGAREILDEVRQ
jgi:hydroxymethylbilane synthase